MPKYEFSVNVRVRYLSQQSNPESDEYAFAYTVTIRNTGNVKAQLISRHWIITDANEHVEEVKGLGVVGEQPVLEPGQNYEYTSGCPLQTPVGTMRGSYMCLADDGTAFEATIAEFSLAMPRTLH